MDPRFIFFYIFFSNIRFLSFIVALSLLAKNAVPMVKSVTFGSLEPLLPFSKAPPKKTLKMTFFTIFLCHLEPPCQNYLGPLFPFLKGPPNGHFQKLHFLVVLLCHTHPFKGSLNLSKTEMLKNNNFFLQKVYF